jgi:Phage head-tail joining protein
MTAFSSQQIAYMRRIMAQFLKDTCALKRLEDTKDELGGSAALYITVNATLKCRMLPLSDKNNNFVAGQGEQARTYFRLIMPYDTDVQDGDQVEFSGDTYEVQQIEDAQTDAVDKRARLMRLG